MEILNVLQEKLGEEVFTEDFKKEMEAQFEVIINEKVQTIVQEKLDQVITEKEKEYKAKKKELTEKLKQEAAEYKVELEESIDGYLDYAVKEFFVENKVAIENEYSVKAAKELVEKFAEILESNHFTVDVDQEKRMEVMESKIAEMQAKTNKLVKENIDYKGQIEEYKKSLKFKKLTEGLSKVKVEKVLALTEGLDFKDMADFERKIKLCVSRVSDKPVMEKREEKEELVTEKKEQSFSVDKYL